MRSAVRKPTKRPAEYTESGYPKNNPKFAKEAARVLKKRQPDIEKLDRFFEEWASVGHKRLKPSEG